MSNNRTWLLTTAVALALSAATHASAATEVYVDSMGQYNNAKVEITGPSFYKNPDSNAINILANYGIGPSADTFTIWGFCVDIFRTADPGYSSQKDQNLQYHIGDLADDGNGNSLSAAQIQQIYGLAALGHELIEANAADLQNKLSGIQGAIWAIEYPAFTIDGATDSLDAYIAGYVAQAPTLHGGAYVLLSDTGANQDFVVGSGAPEPATWAMMIIGFGAIGQALRSRRRRLHLA